MLSAVVRSALRHRGVAVGLACALVLIGATTLARAPLDVVPEFAPPQVSIQTEAPGLSPEQVEVLVTRPRDPGDNASPSGFSSLVHALVDAHALTGVGRYRDAAEVALGTVAVLAEKAPRFAGWSLAAAVTMLDGPLEVAVVGPAGEQRDALEARALAIPGAVVVTADRADPGIPLLEGREPIGGRAAAYVCRGFVCERPVTEPDDLPG